MKSLTLIAIFLSITCTSLAQTFEITDVETSEARDYEKHAEMLGESLVLKFYDKSVTITKGDGSDGVNLRKISDTQYFYSKPGSGLGFELFINTTFNFITSIEFVIKRSVFNEPKKLRVVKYKAKRF